MNWFHRSLRAIIIHYPLDSSAYTCVVCAGVVGYSHGFDLLKRSQITMPTRKKYRLPSLYKAAYFISR